MGEHGVPGSQPLSLGERRGLFEVVADFEVRGMEAVDEAGMGLRGGETEVVGGRDAQATFDGKEHLVTGNVANVDVVAKGKDGWISGTARESGLVLLEADDIVA